MTTGADKSLRPARLFSATHSSPRVTARPSRHTVRSRPATDGTLRFLGLPFLAFGRLGLSSRQCDSSGKALDHTSRPLVYILHFARRNRAHELGISWQIAQKSHVEALPGDVPCRGAFP